MILFEHCYTRAELGMCGFGTGLMLAWGWIWIVVGLLAGAIIGLFHKHLKIVVPIVAFVLLVPICYFIYDNYIRERNNGAREGDQIENYGEKFIFKNGQWQSY